MLKLSYIKNLISYVHVIQFYRLYMHWRILIKSQRTEIIYDVFHETAFQDISQTVIFVNEAVGKI